MQGIRWWSSFANVAQAEQSGIHIERDFFGVYDLRESKVVRYRMYESREEALEAAGLSE